jgi:hypothetical protein
MTDEELKQMSERLAQIAARTPELNARIYKALGDLRNEAELVASRQETWDEAVGAELVRLEVENAALREIARELIYHAETGVQFYLDAGDMKMMEEAEQVIAKARALLGKSSEEARDDDIR